MEDACESAAGNITRMSQTQEAEEVKDGPAWFLKDAGFSNLINIDRSLPLICRVLYCVYLGTLATLAGNSRDVVTSLCYKFNY